MSDKRRALGRGLGALIPPGSGGSGATRPVDVFFKESTDAPAGSVDTAERPSTPEATPTVPASGGSNDAQNTGQNEASSQVSGTNGATPADAAGASETAASHSATSAEADSDSELLAVPGARFAEVPLDAIRPNPRQPRTVFDEDDLAELVHSIKEIGVLQPVVVRPIPAGTTDVAEGVEYELIMGERRWRASREAGNDTVPAIIKATEDDDLLRDALLENLHRSQLNPLEEAAAYQQLLDDFACTQEELATRIGRSRPQVSNTLRLLKLPPIVARRVAAGVLSAGHARALLAVPDAAAMERLAQRIVAEGLSVRSVEEIVALGLDDEKPAKRRPRAGGRHPQLDDLAASLSDRLETRVGIALGKSRGKVTIDFASVEDLNRILDAMNLRSTSASVE
ncbi:ParB/RepB/Spo0J family partition protein [Knoellia subterranea]|uniref:Chromosome partitioning protein ParB n=1 Tax=Knoellia subterranea KCTC 19937 TaxID=1385521 RepID=A0A0A0JMZ1_9MICO|nr:ParB/RepB/Spo0J family partition protein [Knoellia subterranea]KGN37427.1 chromosome partitioning protein ParB [Knoellia subterranea KCTC 19937]